MKETAPWSIGGAAVTFPAWGEFLNNGWQVFVAVMGAVVLAMTIYSKYLEIKQRRRDLAK